MIQTQRLRHYIKQSGYRLDHIHATLGISDHSFRDKLNNRSEFKVSEARKLILLLGIPDQDAMAIFFNQEVENNSTQQETEAINE